MNGRDELPSQGSSGDSDGLLAAVKRIKEQDQARRDLVHEQALAAQHIVCCSECGCILAEPWQPCPEYGSDGPGFEAFKVSWLIAKFVVVPSLIVLALIWIWISSENDRRELRQEMDLLEMQYQR